MKKLPVRLSLTGAAAVAAFSTVIACSGTSDPTTKSFASSGARAATVSGTIVASEVPANAHVAVVWRAGSALAVGGDAPVVGRNFKLELAEPPSDYFFQVDGQSTGPLTNAVAGFVVYIDANGNGKLDLDPSTGTSKDEIVGGNRKIALTYLKGGSSLDYESLRDSTGVIPNAGYNLRWQDRWRPLDVVELDIAKGGQLPSQVCSATPGYDGGSSAASSSSEEPRKGLRCDADGRGYCWKGCSTPTPEPFLCSSDEDTEPMCEGECQRLQDGDAPPADWPCPIAADGGAPVPDGGAAPDAGQ